MEVPFWSCCVKGEKRAFSSFWRRSCKRESTCCSVCFWGCVWAVAVAEQTRKRVKSGRSFIGEWSVFLCGLEKRQPDFFPWCRPF